MKRYKCTRKLRTKQNFFLIALILGVVYLFNPLNQKHEVFLVEPDWKRSGQQFLGSKLGISNIELGDGINCSAIYELDPVEIGRTLEIRRRKIVDLEDKAIESMTADCVAYSKHRGYQRKIFSPEEVKFPIAYSLVVHKDAVMVERLINAIYMPQNVYCIHYDQKSPSVFKAAMKNIAKCFPNVFIASKLESVQYAHISRLQADLNCLADLLKSPVQWKYVTNLCGQDFPLRSNVELVSEFKKLNEANMVETSKPSNNKKQRFLYHHELQKVPYDYGNIPTKTNISKTPPPHKIEMFVGSAYFTLTHEFTQYILENPVAKDFLAWSEDTYSPDEHFWASMVRVPGVPGGIPQSAPDVTDLQSKTRLVKWSYLAEELYPPCTGTYQRSVCIYGAAELRWLLQYGHWFANKFDSKVDPFIIKCLGDKLEQEQRKWVTLAFQKASIL
ncbi:beta-1,3-galactosyl-O-glycosyl-glycoprotein beta-1,6-N-acetylglucosaminyltransferase 4 [Latimeria chalumnae]|uniref:Glucosaminyl (N-acetyl) transferase 4 n=1 Tax=Latimeria chalumnae TaxID=7897 RepID=H3AT19_LATCH|nr:PREDICTED: beta-1,3-galactosyl-O-glycosyl-glycoprotein beta-1,6-N-acetylglucosaminyltransferase 4 [Latimeria chalumnae]|eukprot:XP_006006674.1 PREDICTED: beta-1,3-galactosyl-O-glycosyl-glycoprotein beta-1,6-N-acetylglucosaminyltransferase 4 [Latimeria chalumnae]